ncbi:hypothetical protein B5S31_g3257 [[Candida] boidinii]|nr:hypothetical protein B5S29_g2133 [[Candida] boidinii]OWB73511.1 hypothetical protein B5S31_g3257 [[Candida] boidinii]OWB78179.1 hypothetical protein B5S32_g2367 [[Candida] boidinii]GME92981.1 unnamed protein product [[Candida] boidinii]
MQASIISRSLLRNTGIKLPMLSSTSTRSILINKNKNLFSLYSSSSSSSNTIRLLQTNSISSSNSNTSDSTIMEIENNFNKNISNLSSTPSSSWSKHSFSLPTKEKVSKKELSKEQEQEQPKTIQDKKQRKKRRQLKPRKALITLTPHAVYHLKNLMNLPDPKLIRIGVKNRGCSGLSYHLEYVSKPENFDEMIEQDGVKVLIDSKALFSIVGSEMDWVDDKLSSKFVFKNPNSKGTCGCGESFMV